MVVKGEVEAQPKPASSTKLAQILDTLCMRELRRQVLDLPPGD